MINESEEDFEKRMGKVFRLRKIDEYVHEDVFGVSLGIRNTAWVIIESNPVAYLILVSIHNRVAGAEIRIGKKGSKEGYLYLSVPDSEIEAESLYRNSRYAYSLIARCM